MNRKASVRRICKNALMLALFCIVGMFSIPIGTNIKVSLQLLMVYLLCLTAESFIDCLIVTSLYLLLGLALPFYAGFNIGVTPTFGYVISFVFISPIIYFLNKIPKVYPPIRMFIACLVGLIICYAIGTVFMMLYLEWNFKTTFAVSVIPYIPFDIAKIVVSILVVMMLPKNITETKE